ncbi:MAG: carbohydrate ABC transporter permease [Chloroflexi bacterium]|nr:MAG: carbohydrate ABC transporter permease [Chloroflexota bacterium]
MAVAARRLPRYREEVIWWDRIKIPLFYAVLIGWTIVCITPFWLSLVYSLMPKEHVFDMPPKLWPHPFSLDNYRVVVTTFELFPRWLLNSTLIAVVVTIVRTIFCAMGGYAFARLRFPGRNLLFILMLASMMIPPQVTLVPNYLIIAKVFHLLDNLLAVILPGITTAFGVFMMTQFYKSIPVELEEAALIDGANRFQIFFRIILPISRAALITLALFTFQGSWNEFMWPLIVLQTPEKFTLPLGLKWFQSEYYTLYSIVLAGSLFNSLPIIIIFFVFQRYFIRSIAVTGLKGV